MFCDRCGAPLADGAKFCTRCGAPVPGAEPSEVPAPEPVLHPLPDPPEPAADAPAAEPAARELGRVTPQRARGDSYASYQSVAAVAAANAPQQRAARRRRRNRVIAVVAVLVVALAAVGVASYFWYRADRERVASETLHNVTVVLKADGFNTSTGSKLPVRIVGTNDAGKVDEVDFVADDGSGIQLARGSYELSFPASPIAQDGTLYQVSDVTIRFDVTGGSDDASSSNEPAKANADQPVELTPITDWTTVTDDQLKAAEDYVRRDGACSKGVDAGTLVDAATTKRDDAVAAKKAAEEKAAAEEAEKKKQAEQKAANHVEASSYTFDAPSYWYGRVTLKLDGDTLHVYSSTYPDLEVCRVIVTLNGVNTQPFGGTADAVQLKDGANIAGVYYTDYGLMISYYNSINSTDPAAQYTREQADELVDLQTGGQLTYDDYLALDQSQFELARTQGNSGSPTADKMAALLKGCVKAK